MSQFNYYKMGDGEETWKPVPISHRYQVETEQRPMFMTVLSVSKLAEDLSHEDMLKLQYEGPLYYDFDSKDEELVIVKVNQFLDKLVEMRVDLDMCRLFITGGKGYHIEVPQPIFLDKVPKNGIAGLPSIYREVALELCVDTLDLQIYSAKRGRMWRQPNVLRSNGRYKVAITATEMREMTVELAQVLSSAPKPLIEPKPPELCIDLNILYTRCAQKVDELMKKRAKFKPDPKMREKAGSFSIQWMMAGLGIKESAGFQAIATQLAIAATAAGLTEQKFIEECEQLITTHKGDGARYGSESKRAEELRRMWRYMNGNPCYEFSVGAIKALLTHSAPDLDGIETTKDEVLEVIEEAKQDVEEGEIDEYGDVAKGVTLAKHGIYVDTDYGKKRVCAVTFAKPSVLRSAETGQIVGYESDIMVNGKFAGRQTLELDVFGGLLQFNRFLAKHGHAFQGTDPQVRTVMMRFVEAAKKKGEVRFILKREGLDLVHIPNHDNPLFHKPFLVWADAHGVIVPAALVEEGLELTFAGYPDPRGVYKTDIAAAPALAAWVKEDGNRQALKDCLQNLMTCQRPELLGKYLGWYTACFWKQLFNRAYKKFPLLHVNGQAGAGKCLGADTPVLLADGEVRLVQYIKPGDYLLGPDGGRRLVKSVCSGRDQLYRITPIKGDAYVVNSQHILSLKKSEKPSVMLSDGTRVAEDADVVNVNVEVYARSSKAARKTLKGWRSDALEFHREAEDLPLDPYWLGAWLGDGNASGPAITKPGTSLMVGWWKTHAAFHGHGVTEYRYTEDGCPTWNITGIGTHANNTVNRFTDGLRELGLVRNKHIPQRYMFSSIENRLQLLAGLLDSDGHLTDSGFDWISKDKDLAEDFAFICRSVGLACYITPCQKGIASTGFVGNYWRCSVSGNCDKIPCLDKRAAPRRQVKRATVTGVSVEAIGEGDYYGFELDGDRLFLLGDFTVTHNSEMTSAFSSLFYFEQETKVTSPSSTVFALGTYLTASSSIPLILDEYKPHAMTHELHDKLKSMFRSAYNQGDVVKGGGNRESEDYRALHSTQLAAPMVFIAEAAEDESAVMERVVLATVVRPPAGQALKWLARFQAFSRNKHFLGILGQYLAAQIVQEVTLDSFREEFDALYDEAKEKYMLSEKDLAGGCSEDVLKDKQNAKERSVYNHTVARFGFRQFRKLVNDVLGGELDHVMAELEDGIYARMSDLNAATTPEIIKVLETMCSMSHHVEADRNDSMRKGHEYAFSAHGKKDCLELAVRPAYMRYRAHERSAGIPPLFNSFEAFGYACRDMPAFVKFGIGDVLSVPNVYVFDVDELARLGVNMFREK